VRVRGAWSDFPQPIKSIILNDDSKSRLPSLVDNSSAKNNENFGELAAGRMPAKIFCNPSNLIDISN